MAIPLWTVVIWRASTLLKTPGQRALWACFVFLAIAATLRLSGIETWVIDITGVDEVVSVSKHIAVILGGLLMLRWVDSSAPEAEPTPMWRRLAHDRPRNIVAVVGVVAAIATAPLASPAIIENGTHRVFLEAQYSHLGGTISLAPYILISGISMVMSGYLSTLAARRYGKRLLKVCMGIFTVGCWSGALYFGFVGAYLLYGLTGADAPISLALVQVVGNLTQLLCIVGLAVGSSVKGFDAMMNLKRFRRWLIDLRPLWGGLASVLPADAVEDVLHKSATTEAYDRRNIRRLYERLDDRVIVIVDAALGVSPWIAEDLPGRALAAAKAEGLTGNDARAAAEAVCLRIARDARRDGQDPAEHPTEIPPLTLGKDTEDSAPWLSQVSHYYQLPLMRTLQGNLDSPLEPA
ncbi:DUF6545 domain-containing protein [Streptomyces sp. MBT27]|uniref:DUF6545 domain-containing protein n=1 Tax=Streptomyces sp. MBT27 TaxID=1488356 RepID=UPI0014200F87|nr:DUF6545 domain-containing protein [Streptomyces sp. MBT27]